MTSDQPPLNLVPCSQASSTSEPQTPRHAEAIQASDAANQPELESESAQQRSGSAAGAAAEGSAVAGAGISESNSEEPAATGLCNQRVIALHVCIEQNFILLVKGNINASCQESLCMMTVHSPVSQKGSRFVSSKRNLVDNYS